MVMVSIDTVLMQQKKIPFWNVGTKDNLLHNLFPALIGSLYQQNCTINATAFTNHITISIDKP